MLYRPLKKTENQFECVKKGLQEELWYIDPWKNVTLKAKKHVQKTVKFLKNYVDTLELLCYYVGCIIVVNQVNYHARECDKTVKNESFKKQKG